LQSPLIFVVFACVLVPDSALFITMHIRVRQLR
jgi:hypothetical protein